MLEARDALTRSRLLVETCLGGLLRGSATAACEARHGGSSLRLPSREVTHPSSVHYAWDSARRPASSRASADVFRGEGKSAGRSAINNNIPD